MVQTVECSDQPLDLVFHPGNPNLVAAGLVDGTIEVHNLPENEGSNAGHHGHGDDDSETDTILSTIPVHTMQVATDPKRAPSCRSILFSHDGQYLYTGGSGGDICALDANISCSLGASETALLWRLPPRSDAVHTLKQLPLCAPCGPLLCAGYENGSVQLWDTRLCGGNYHSFNSFSSKACVMSWDEHQDYVSGFEHAADGATLLASCADCTMSIMDLRKPGTNSQTSKASSDAVFWKSDDQEDELLSIVLMKNGRKVMCGTQQGVLAVWSWGTWGDVSDRFPGHPASIDALLKVDEDTVLTGASDGMVRLVQLHPDKLLGVLGDHEGFPVEKLQFNADRSYVGSVSHDNFIRLWDARILQDDNEDDDHDEEMDDEDDRKMPAIVTNKVKNHDSDDDWEDIEDESEDEVDSDEDDDTDDSDEEEETANDRRSKRLKTENEKFFDGL